MNTDATFTGIFDGNGYAIKNGTFSSANGNKPGGLFGEISKGSIVKNLAITNATLTTEEDYDWVFTSILTGGARIKGTLDNCYIDITQLGSSTNAMGIACHANGAYIKNVILKSVSGLNKNICDMVLTHSIIKNTYAIGGSATNSGYTDGTSSINIEKVSSLTEAQQSKFNDDIWGFDIDGLPYFIREY